MKLYLISAGSRCRHGGKNNQTLKFNKIRNVASERAGERAKPPPLWEKKNVQMEKTTNRPTNRSGNKKQTQTKERNIIFYIYIYVSEILPEPTDGNQISEEKLITSWGGELQQTGSWNHNILSEKKKNTHTPNFDVLSFLPENTAVCVCDFFFTFVFLFSPTRSEDQDLWRCSAPSGGNLYVHNKVNL